MELRPRYGNDPIIRVEGLATDPVPLMVGQRARLASILSQLDDAQWHAPSRCDGWTVQDVVTHLTTTNQFWAFSITSGLAGEPTTFLSSFDPVRSPAEFVRAAGRPPSAETLAAFVESNAALAASLEEVGDRLWTTLAEAPPGHLAVGCLVLHALWDSVIHERDIVVPLGIEATTDPGELGASVLYVIALSLAFRASIGSDRRGVVEVCTTGPELQLSASLEESVLVRPGPSTDASVRLTGASLELLEAFSCRAPVPDGVAAEDRWIFEGLAEVFDQPAGA